MPRSASHGTMAAISARGSKRESIRQQHNSCRGPIPARLVPPLLNHAALRNDMPSRIIR